jgi:hypothetical protein
MKNFYVILAWVAVGYLGFVIWVNRRPPVSQVAAVVAVTTNTPTPTPKPTATPTATPVAVVVASPTPQLNLAPDGTYFLLQRVSVMTDSGISGDAPGTKVTLVNAGPPMRVTDGQNEFEVQPSQVTNDLDVAQRVFYADKAAQSEIKAMRGKVSQQPDKQLEAAQKLMIEKQHELGQSVVQPLPMSTGELNEGPRSVNGIQDGGNYKSRIH